MAFSNDTHARTAEGKILLANYLKDRVEHPIDELKKEVFDLTEVEQAVKDESAGLKSLQLSIALEKLRLAAGLPIVEPRKEQARKSTHDDHSKRPITPERPENAAEHAPDKSPTLPPNTRAT